MTMHMMSPQFNSLNTKKRKKVKFKSAEHKRQHLENIQKLAEQRAQYPTTKSTPVKNSRSTYKHVLNVPADRSSRNIPSHGIDSSVNGTCARVERPVYSGTAIIGICLAHKSNYLPVTNGDHARDITRMRRG